MGKTNSGFVVVALMSCFYLDFGTGTDTITPFKSIKDPEAIISKGGVFRLGFFNLTNSNNRYVGILYNQIPVQSVVWIANRNKPLKDFSGILNLSSDGNLVVFNGKSETLWSSNVTNSAPNTTTAQLLDSGNLVLYNGNNNNGVNLWESFQHPSRAFLKTMKISTNVKTGQKVELRSWKSPDDPSDGNFSLSLEPFNIPESVVWYNDQLFFRTGPWNGSNFIGMISMDNVYLDGVYLLADDEKKWYYFTFESSNTSLVMYYEFDPHGQLIEHQWEDGKGEWMSPFSIILNDCDIYGKCGVYGVCDSTKRPICRCLKGFEPRNVEEWRGGNWSGGCVRTTHLQCQKEGFLKLVTMKVPAFPDRSSTTYGGCEDLCMKNCSCVAHAYDAGIGCMFWSGDLIDMQKFPFGGVDLFIRLPSSEIDNEKRKSKIIVITTVIPSVISITIFALCLRCWMAKKRGRKQNGKQKLNKGNAGTIFSRKDVGENSIQDKLQLELPLFRFKELATATNNFHPTKMLGQGGFGPVYRGTLDDGKEIAVKRLSKASGQGLEEFMNEVVVISKLQHRNLVRLLGCCVEGEEKMLVYEYMPNKSLDAFLFDPDKQKLLDWRKRFNIIEGISRGLLYLHRDSRLRIIHRDLKTSNVLLDEELNPKISDFGLARIFGGNKNQANTKRVVGTYGYMPPEYVMRGQFSEKSDVFSFGVLLLEIVSGKKITSFYNDDNHLSLLGYAWQLWNEDNISGLIDNVVLDSDSDLECEKDIRRCIHVGLLCVQEHAKDRPTMSTVVSMLNSEISDLNPPNKPAFTQASEGSQDVEVKFSFNDVTLTDLDGR